MSISRVLPSAAEFYQAFARMGPSATTTNSRAATTITLWQTWKTTLRYPVHGQIGGWTLDAHHSYDVYGFALNLGTAAHTRVPGLLLAQ